ncbi:MAG: hypothetical protein H7X95_11400 [Deltaproteobacteria bacterium]|nr:hypothetical protein [Deltaproteobacteria bacterium]
MILVAAAAALSLMACRQKGQGQDKKTPVAAGATSVPSPVGGAAVRFEQIAAIVNSACAMPCHDGRGGAADDFLFAEDGTLLQRLQVAPPVSVPVPCQNRPLVVPGNPERSLLMAVIEEPDGPRAGCAERMPHGCPEKRPCLAAGEIQKIRTWIKSGAPR